jgi:hypothetical protein
MNDRLKALGSRLLIIGSLGSSLLLPTLFTPTPSLAGAEDGVKCPAGFDVDFNQSRGILKCKKEKRETRPTTCDPFRNTLHTEYKSRKGKIDRCAPANLDIPFLGEVPLTTENKTKPITCVGLATDNPPWKVKIDGGPGSRDICERTIVEFKYPNQL